MRILFFMTHPGHARTFETTLRELLRRGDKVEIALTEDAAGGIEGSDALLAPLAREHEGLAVSLTPPRPRLGTARISAATRLVLDYLRYVEGPLAGSERLRSRARHRLPRFLQWPLDHAPAGVHAALRAGLMRLLKHLPPSRTMDRWLEERRADVAVLTPVVETGSPQVEWIRAVRRRGVPSCVAVSSWDSLVTKGGLYLNPDAVAVWNDAQAGWATGLHPIDERSVRIVGAYAFDRWHGAMPSRSRAELARDAGFDPDEAYLLYVCSSPFIAPEEGRHIARCIQTIRDGPAPLSRIQLLVREHPLAAGRTAAALEHFDGIHTFPAVGANPVDRISQADYFDSVFHSAAVIGVNTSAFLEAAIINRPVHAHLPEDDARSQLQMVHLAALTADRGGPVTVSQTAAGFRAALTAILADPAPQLAANAAFAEALAGPDGPGRAAAALADVIEQLAARPQASGR